MNQLLNSEPFDSGICNPFKVFFKKMNSRAAGLDKPRGKMSKMCLQDKRELRGNDLWRD